MDASHQTRVVLAHDWLTGMRGGEKCLEALCRRWPDAHLYTLLHRRGSVSTAIEQMMIHPSFLQRLPAVHRYYRYLLPIMPMAVSSWRLPACDLVVSFSHCVAKGVRAPAGVPHICYCFTPMRYAWHMRDAYFEKGSRPLFDWILARLREWDRRTAERVTHFIAISRTVRQRIIECYDRSSTVIYPPVDTGFYTPAPLLREDYYLSVSAFAPYKRLDLAVAACNQLKRKLVLIGTGQDENQLRALAGPTIHFLGWQPDTVIRDHMRRCRALLFPGEEDFGIVPVEAQACGTPVIAYGRGGATETVIPHQESAFGIIEAEPTGVWFHEQHVDGLVEAIDLFERRPGDFHPAVVRRQAQRFNQQRFTNELFAYLDRVLQSPSMPARRAA